MTDLTKQALALWGFETSAWDFVAGRENRVYRVRSDAGEFALRLKRTGYRTEAELISELQWLDAMDREGLSVPQPRPALTGNLLESVGGHYVDVIGWLSGVPLGRSRDPLDLPDATGVFHRLGQEMARLHDACDRWERPEGFVRSHWDATGLLGDAPLWGRFWENPTLGSETKALLYMFRQKARRDLDGLEDTLDYGLVHADLVRENVLLDGSTISLIDFDDGGFGYRLFDVATALVKNRAEPNFPELKTGLIAGYHSVRPLDMSKLDLFIALRAVTYVGWIVPRMAEDGSSFRNERFIEDARQLCAEYLGESYTA